MIFDEPSLGLAPLIIEQIYEALQELRKSGMAILVVEENPSRILNFADKIELTKVHHTFEGDTYFENINEKKWKKIYEEKIEQDINHKYSFSYLTYIKI